MKIKEIENILGIPGANIRYYESEGLIKPKREGNGYRNYSQEDVESLRKIIFLRSLQVSLSDIKRLQRGECDLGTVLRGQIKTLNAEQEEIERAKNICMRICADNIGYEALNVDKYMSSAIETVEILREDVIPPVAVPFRRFFARYVDMSLYTLIFNIFLMFVLRVNLGKRSATDITVCTTLEILMMLFIEPLLLNHFGTTLGKWIFGIYVTDNGGGMLPYDKGLKRTWSVLTKGLGMYFPIYSLICGYRCLKSSDAGETLDWEYDSEMVVVDIKRCRNAACVLTLLAFFIVFAFCNVAAGMPRHRGNITTSEFSSNFKDLAKYYKAEMNGAPDKTGKWMPYEQNPYKVDIFADRVKTSFEVIEGENGVSKVRFHYENRNTFAKNCQEEMTITALSFICAQKEFHAFSRAKRDMLKTISENACQNFTYEYAGIKMSCDIEYSGYVYSNGMLWTTDSDSRHEMTLDFVITKDH